MIRFRLFDIPVSIHWMFWLLAGFLGGALRIEGAGDFVPVLLFMAAATFSILVHEFGHAFAGLKLGAPSVQIMLHGMGGLAHFERASFSRKDSILMTAAGPGASIVLAVLSILFASFVDLGESSLVAYTIGVLIIINVVWTIINLLPILPMDGGQILLALLGPSRLRLTCIISFITLGILAVLLWLWTESIFNMVVMAFLASQTWKLYQTTQPGQ